MARGWESKSVEAQIDAAEMHRGAVLQKVQTREHLERVRQKESLMLSRTRVVRELETARNSRYRDILAKALAELEVQIAALAD